MSPDRNRTSGIACRAMSCTPFHRRHRFDGEGLGRGGVDELGPDEPLPAEVHPLLGVALAIERRRDVAESHRFGDVAVERRLDARSGRRDTATGLAPGHDVAETEARRVDAIVGATIREMSRKARCGDDRVEQPRCRSVEYPGCVPWRDRQRGRAPVRSTEPCVCPATNGPAPSDTSTESWGYIPVAR